MSLPSSTFVERLLQLNGLDAGDFAGWEFATGMCFGETVAWWREGGARDAPHEGLDLRAFRTAGGASGVLGPGTRVPALWPGTVVAIVPDFLGRSIFIAHDRRDGGGRRLHSVYGHVDPRAGLAPGARLDDGEEIGTVADPAAKRSRVPAHLHLTAAWIDDSTSGLLDWSVLRNPARTLLVDPLPFLWGTIPPPGAPAGNMNGGGTHGP